MQIILNGLVSGLGMALTAVAFQAVYLPTRVFFIALAAVYTAAPFLVLEGHSRGLPWAISVIAAVAVGGTIAVACEWFNHRRLEKKGASTGIHLVTSLGMYLVIVHTVAMIWGNDPQTLKAGIDPRMFDGTVSLTQSQVITILTAVASLAGFALFLGRTNTGLRLRALAQNPNQFELLGYPSARYRLVSFAVAGMMASIGSLVSANDVGFDAQTGLNAVLLGVVAVIIGGRDTFWGPAVGAMLLGLMRSLVVLWGSTMWVEAATFLLLAAVLLFRPRGLLAPAERWEACG